MINHFMSEIKILGPNIFCTKLYLVHRSRKIIPLFLLQIFSDTVNDANAFLSFSRNAPAGLIIGRDSQN
jgi:hypothetical protein